MNNGSGMSKTKKSSVDAVFVLTIFTLFMCCLLLVVLVFVGVYKNTGERINARFNSGTAVSLVTRKLSAYDCTGAISAAEYDGLSVLCLSETIDGAQYNTYIYCHNGKLCELFAKAEQTFDPDMGSGLVEAQNFTIEIKENTAVFEIRTGKAVINRPTL